MTLDLQHIETVLILIMENRSFDHVLGYLSLPPENRQNVEGLKGNRPFSNIYQDKAYPSFALQSQLFDDPPHERENIALQIGLTAQQTAGELPMSGFVESYAKSKHPPEDLSLVMGYHTAQELPIYDFFAKNFAICDHWFCSLPTGTQPNRLMAMSGESAIAKNVTFLLPEQKLVYDWLNQRNISWCSYNYGHFPFFSLMHKWQKTILEDFALPVLDRARHFRKYEDFHADWKSPKTLPQVIFIEPEYTDILDNQPNDDHPPTGMAQGQQFIRSIYETLISNPERWNKSLLLITYDEHGGCYDHVSPLWVKTEPPQGADYDAFPITGVRVPSFIISPYVEAGTVYKEPLDHTAILAFLAERFDKHQSYSSTVDERQRHFGRLSEILTRATPRTDIPKPPELGEVKASRPVSTAELTASANANAAAFQEAIGTMKAEHPVLWPLFCKMGPEQ